VERGGKGMKGEGWSGGGRSSEEGGEKGGIR